MNAKVTFYLLSSTDPLAHGVMLMGKLGLDFNHVLSCLKENWAVEFRLVALVEWRHICIDERGSEVIIGFVYPLLIKKREESVKVT